MASLEKRIQVLEVTRSPVMPPRINITFVCPVRGTVSARLWSGARVDRLNDETEAKFLARLEQQEVAHGQA